MRQREPSVLQDTVEAAEGESAAEATERVSCDESSKSRVSRGKGYNGLGAGAEST